MTIKTTFVTINYIIHIGTSVSWETFGTVQNRTFKAWNWTLAGDNFTGYIYDGRSTSHKAFVYVCSAVQCIQVRKF